jgi:hypothetical protein
LGLNHRKDLLIGRSLPLKVIVLSEDFWLAKTSEKKTEENQVIIGKIT